MFNKIFAFSLLIGAVTAQIKDGVYRILDPEINSIGYVAKSGYEIGTPVTLGLSRPEDLHELWVVKRVPNSPPNYYTLLNIGQDYPTYATDHVVSFRDGNYDLDVPEEFVFTDTKPHPYYIESPKKNGIYGIYTGRDRSQAWTASSKSGYPISIQGVGVGGQKWRFVPAFEE